MKIISKLIIIICLILSINQWFAIKKSSINLEQNPKIQNTDDNIRQAESLEKDVADFKNKLIIIQKKYKLEDDNTIKNSLKNISEIIYILRKIQTTKINKNTAENVIKIVINELKDINSSTKSYLKNIKYNVDKSKEIYNKASMNLYYKLNKLTLDFIKYYKNKEKLTKKDKEIIKVVQNIYKNSLKIKNFKNIDFYNKEDMKEYLINILKDIKNNFIEIRKIVKK